MLITPITIRIATSTITTTTTTQQQPLQHEQHTAAAISAGTPGKAAQPSHAQQPSAGAAPRPYCKVPRTRTALGLNLDMFKDPFKSSQYMVEQVRLLGPIFKVTGLPGCPEMVVTVSPQDVETVYRNGDTHYPEKFSFREWKQALEELNRPLGLFLE